MVDDDFEHRVAEALRAPTPASVDARRRIMDRVRRLDAGSRPRPARIFPRSGNVRTSLIGAALAAGMGSLGVLPSLVHGGRVGQPAARVSAVIGDSVGATLRDTIRLVRLMFFDSAARDVAVVGTFNGWRPDSTPLAHEPGTGEWSATILMRDGEHRYAFVVDGTRWAVDPAAPRARDAGGRLVSLLHVVPVAN